MSQSWRSCIPMQIIMQCIKVMSETQKEFHGIMHVCVIVTNKLCHSPLSPESLLDGLTGSSMLAKKTLVGSLFYQEIGTYTLHASTTVTAK